jgi:hypothetical protein
MDGQITVNALIAPAGRGGAVARLRQMKRSSFSTSTVSLRHESH